MVDSISVRDATNNNVTVATNNAVIANLVNILNKLPVGTSVQQALLSISASATPVVMGASAAITVTGLTCTVLMAASARKGLLIHNEGPGTVYVQSSNTNNKSPLAIGEGSIVPVYLAQALWAYNPNASSAALFIAELT